MTRRDRRQSRRTSLAPRPEGAGSLAAVAGRPPWVPSDIDVRRVDPEAQQAVRDIVQPAYEQFVLQTPDVLERSLGLTVTHLLWLEILDQFNLKRDFAKFVGIPELLPDNTRQIDRHLRLIDSKVKLASVMLRLRKMRQSSRAEDYLPPPPHAPLSIPADLPPNPPTPDPPMHLAGQADGADADSLHLR